MEWVKFIFISLFDKVAEEKAEKGYASPNNLEEAAKAVEDCKV